MSFQHPETERFRQCYRARVARRRASRSEPVPSFRCVGADTRAWTKIPPCVDNYACCSPLAAVTDGRLVQHAGRVCQIRAHGSRRRETRRSDNSEQQPSDRLLQVLLPSAAPPLPEQHPCASKAAVKCHRSPATEQRNEQQSLAPFTTRSSRWCSTPCCTVQIAKGATGMHRAARGVFLHPESAVGGSRRARGLWRRRSDRRCTPI